MKSKFVWKDCLFFPSQEFIFNKIITLHSKTPACLKSSNLSENQRLTHTDSRTQKRLKSLHQNKTYGRSNMHLFYLIGRDTVKHMNILAVSNRQITMPRPNSLVAHTCPACLAQSWNEAHPFVATALDGLPVPVSYHLLSL